MEKDTIILEQTVKIRSIGAIENKKNMLTYIFMSMCNRYVQKKVNKIILYYCVNTNQTHPHKHTAGESNWIKQTSKK